MTQPHSHRRDSPSRRRRPGPRSRLAFALSGTLVAVAVPVALFASGGGEEPGAEPAKLTAATPAALPEMKEVSFWTPTSTIKPPLHRDKTPMELGTRFTVARDGWVAGVRFYKAKGEKGKHTGSLWDAKGAKLASVQFTAETPSGWQEARFGAPVKVRAGTTYTISYHSTHGTYVGKPGVTGLSAGPMAIPARRNGVYRYGTSGFPRESNPKNYHYYVDPIFRWMDWRPKGDNASNPPVTPAETVTASTPPGTTTTPTPTPTHSVTVTPSPSPSPSPSSPSPSPTPSPSRTATPTPTPTFTAVPLPPDTGSRTCSGFPTPACTGVPPGTQLKKLPLNFDGDSYRVTQPGTVLDGVHVPGTLLITADNVTVR
ncbi:DUF4082 domain-containing protein, partial [Acrocarpospora corrugata]